MTETTTTQTPETTVGTTTPPEGTDDAQDGDNPGREAARYRRRLRETETERDTLAERVAALQRREVERIAAEHLAQPGDLFAIGGTELADLLDDDGVPDPERITAAAGTLLEARPGLAAVPPPQWPDMGQGKQGASTPPGASWSKALSGR